MPCSINIVGCGIMQKQSKTENKGKKKKKKREVDDGEI